MILDMAPTVLTIYAIVFAAAYVAFSSARLETRTKRLIHRIIAAPSATGSPISFDGLAEVPPPVARYLHLALTPGHRAPRHVRISQDGEMRLNRGKNAWKWFSAREYLQVGPPAFVWDARLDIMAILDARLVDHYADGHAAIRVKLLSSLPLIEDEDRPELVQSALMRFLADAVWCPTILLPGPGLRWETVDDRSARAIFDDAGTRVSVVFHFNERNEVERVVGEDRYRELDGAYVPTRWTMHYKDYANYGDMHVPRQGMAQWNLPDGDFTYWRGRLRAIDYDPKPTVWE